MKIQIRALILFNERVARLDRSDLAKRMENPNYKLDYGRMINREWISADGLTKDAVDAFVLNVRLLIQDQDGFSIRRLAKDVYAHNSVSSDLQDQFQEQRDKWRQHMDSVSIFRHFKEDRNFTNRELFDILFYGGLAHANCNRVDDFYAITRQGLFSSLVCGSFLHSLRIFLGVVRDIRDINTELLARWKC